MVTAQQKSGVMTDFQNYEATKKLRVLAQQPFDLKKPGNLTPERIRKYTTEGGGYRVLYGMQRLDDKVLQALTELAQEAGAVEKMEAQQAGEIANFVEGCDSENRAVLHTAMRDFFEYPNTGKDAASATELAKHEHKKLKGFMEELDRDNRFTNLVMVGIGGSDLGPRTLYLSLKAYARKDRQVHFISNVDPDDASSVLKGLDLRKTLTVVVSKSGGTLETFTNEEMVRHAYTQAGIDPNKHVVAVTGKGSPMDNPSRYLKSFYIWDYVGGRFSSTSMIGGVMLTFGLGYDNYMEMLRGCSVMDKIALKPDVKENIPLLLALLGIWNHNFLGYPTLAVVPYSQALYRFAAHLQQVDMESNGKCIDKKGNLVDFSTGPIVWGEPGTNAQHSYFQLLHQSPDVIPMEFIGFQQSQFGEDLTVKGTTSQEKLVANMLAQSLALAMGQESDNPRQFFPGNRPSALLLGKKLTPFTMGTIFALYEHKIAFQGYIWNINSFDQEGVQLGKVLANRILENIAANHSGTDGAEPFPLGEALLEQMNGL